MIVNKTDSYFRISPSENEQLSDDREFEIFFNSFVEKNANFKKTNLILDFSSLINIDLKKILLFSQLSESHRNNNKSFVIVCKGLIYDELPDELVVVPTFKEAEDIIEIEDIERDLGI